MYNTKAKSASEVPTILIEAKSHLREGLAKCLETKHFHVIASCSAFGELPSSLDQSPELIVVGGDDIAVVTRVLQDCRERYPAARRVVLSDRDGAHPMEMLGAGAHACLGRDVTVEALLLSFELALSSASFICRSSPPIAPTHSAENQRNRKITETQISDEVGLGRVSHSLSKTEIAVLECLVQGDSNKVIARKRQITEATVKVHIKSILRKMRAANRTQAVVWAMTNLDTKAISDEPPNAA